MAVITISKQQGSLGDKIAVSVARKLNYDCIDKQLIVEALVDDGLQKPEIEKFDEKKLSFLQSFSYHGDKFLHLLKAMIYDFTGKENAVIIGRGAQVLLKDLPGALHVRIIAPGEIRMRRLVEQGTMKASQDRFFNVATATLQGLLVLTLGSTGMLGISMIWL